MLISIFYCFNMLELNTIKDSLLIREAKWGLSIKLLIFNFVITPEKIQDVGLWGIKNEARGVVVPYSISVSVPVPFGFRSIWDLVWVGPRVFWD